MPVNTDNLRKQLKQFEFKALFIEELGWDQCNLEPLKISVNDSTFQLEAIAEKRGMVIFLHEYNHEETLPESGLRKKIERKVAKSYYEHIIIFIDSSKTTQIWQWVKREQSKPLASREHKYTSDQNGERLIQKLQEIYFDINEEDELSTINVAARAKKAFDVDKVTKKFYDRFKKEQTAFLEFIEGIEIEKNRDWYASLMLNRMMFIYFIQKKGFLDNDQNYLRNRLKKMQEVDGKNNFYKFYRYFLLRLFHEGFGQPEKNRNPELVNLLGKVPYLNGGLFDVHDLEKENPEIKIPDEAFEVIFAFFDSYSWHLDERPLRADNEINPDVLGYIFEKYINQKQMGAYYTKEDITGYISRNTIIPFLLHSAKKQCPKDFESGGYIWKLLEENPDRYIYDSMLKGIDKELPENISQGINDVSRRTDWNQPADTDYALPTETWREYIARRKRAIELRTKLSNGNISEIEDLITYNLDICQFAQDAVENSNNPEILRAFWTAIAGKLPEKSNQHGCNGITILDPTCGSGAFLFAALNILEPLYEACLEQMKIFVNELEPASKKLQDFRNILERIDAHPNDRYFVLKSIILNNLFGVDIMAEAVEICKLRLFLKLVSQVENVEHLEPLPDIDFNIRGGNTLVGYATYEEVENIFKGTFDFDNTLEKIEEEALLMDKAFRKFQIMQTQQNMNASEFSNAKIDLRRRLDSLRNELDQYMAKEYGINTTKPKDYQKWQNSHLPFHWFVEFYGIIKSGGFNVIIGNPPYIEFKGKAQKYKLINYETISCGNLFAFVYERSIELSTKKGHIGLIIPVASICTDRYTNFQKIILENGNLIISSFNDRPSKLFLDLEHIRLSIIFLQKSIERRVSTTKYHKWYTSEREKLFCNLTFENQNTFAIDGKIPKIGGIVEASILEKISSSPILESYQSENGNYNIFYTRKLSNFVQVLDFIPKIIDDNEKIREPSELKKISLPRKDIRDVFLCVLNSSLFYYLITIWSDCRNLNKREVFSAPFNYKRANKSSIKKLQSLSSLLMNDLTKNSKNQLMDFKNRGKLKVQCIYPKFSKHIIDEIDRVLAEHYGFTDEELDFIINYDIKYRMGKELNSKAKSS